jgi:PKHD-type hydroxylase
MISPSWSFKTDHIENWTYIPDLFSKQECDMIVEYGNSLGLEQSTIYKNEKVVIETSRKSEHVFISPDPQIDWLYQRLTHGVTNINEEFFKFDLFGFGEGLQFTKYEAPASHYDYHVDRILHGQIRKLSITVQLTDETEYEGGNFQMFGSDQILPRKQGVMLVFPSFMVHRVTPVTKGTRYSLVGWVNGKPFK